MRRQFKDDALVDRIVASYDTAGLDARRLAMCRYADKLTRTPGRMTPADLTPLRDAGLSDTDILHLCEVVSYYAYANRITDGLGVLSEVGDRTGANSWVEQTTLEREAKKQGA
jgi:uncharacterized peroxidase-related enzyme